MSKFKVGDRVRVKAGEYEGYLPGSQYNLPRGDGEVVEAGAGFLTIAYGRVKSPPVNPEAFELAEPTSPVRTSTRKEIVRGKYGRVFVDVAMNGKVGLKINREPIWSDFSPSELRAAAATFIELADALDEEA